MDLAHDVHLLHPVVATLRHQQVHHAGCALNEAQPAAVPLEEIELQGAGSPLTDGVPGVRWGQARSHGSGVVAAAVEVLSLGLSNATEEQQVDSAAQDMPGPQHVCTSAECV